MVPSLLLTLAESVKKSSGGRETRRHEGLQTVLEYSSPPSGLSNRLAAMLT